MRISDWSSDVCSSDLLTAMTRRLKGYSVNASAHTELGNVLITGGASGLGAAVADAVAAEGGTALVIERDKPEEIGRASRRERVCQYVEIPVAAESLKKQTNRNTSTVTNIKHNT